MTLPASPAAMPPSTATASTTSAACAASSAEASGTSRSSPAGVTIQLPALAAAIRHSTSWMVVPSSGSGTT